MDFIRLFIWITIINHVRCYTNLNLFLGDSAFITIDKPDTNLNCGSTCKIDDDIKSNRIPRQIPGTVFEINQFDTHLTLRIEEAHTELEGLYKFTHRLQYLMIELQITVEYMNCKTLCMLDSNDYVVGIYNECNTTDKAENVTWLKSYRPFDYVADDPDVYEYTQIPYVEFRNGRNNSMVSHVLKIHPFTSSVQNVSMGNIGFKYNYKNLLLAGGLKNVSDVFAIPIWVDINDTLIMVCDDVDDVWLKKKYAGRDWYKVSSYSKLFIQNVTFDDNAYYKCAKSCVNAKQVYVLNATACTVAHHKTVIIGIYELEYSNYTIITGVICSILLTSLIFICTCNILFRVRRRRRNRFYSTVEYRRRLDS